jgi:hypothetical protein
MNWASQQQNVPLSVTPFKQAYDFLKRHAPRKRLVISGWGGVVRHFAYFHKALPEDIIFSSLNDNLGWDPVSEEYGKLDSRERWPYAVMFAGLVLTAVGSAYYHLAPNNDRLVWDRIPIMMVVMALLAAVIGERTTVNAGLWLLPFLQAIGVGSVLLWRSSEARGHGDLRLCAAIQVYAIVLLLLMLLVRPRYTRSSDFAVVVGFYVLAKIFEESDRQVFALGHIVSGHTLKHVAAAAASYFVLRMLRKRDLVSRPVR